MKLAAIAAAIAFVLLAFDASPANAGLFDFIGSLLDLAPPPVPVGRLTINHAPAPFIGADLPVALIVGSAWVARKVWGQRR
jgi:hypothetical protein